MCFCFIFIFIYFVFHFFYLLYKDKAIVSKRDQRKNRKGKDPKILNGCSSYCCVKFELKLNYWIKLELKLPGWARLIFFFEILLRIIRGKQVPTSHHYYYYSIEFHFSLLDATTINGFSLPWVSIRIIKIYILGWLIIWMVLVVLEYFITQHRK